MQCVQFELESTGESRSADASLGHCLHPDFDVSSGQRRLNNEFGFHWNPFFSRPIGASRRGRHASLDRYKKQLGVFLRIFNILRKKGKINLKIGEIG
jgi:hypothetical protein